MKNFPKHGTRIFSAKPGLMIPDMIDGLHNGKVRALYVFGENIANTEPDIDHVEKCLASAEFLVCNDIFPTETTRFAHVVFPAAAWSEDDGTFTNSERRVNRVRKAVPPPGESRPNWWIFKEIARRMGKEWKSNSGQEIWDNEVAALCPLFNGIRFPRIENDGLQWPCHCNWIIPAPRSCTRTVRIPAARAISRPLSGRRLRRFRMRRIPLYSAPDGASTITIPEPRPDDVAGLNDLLGEEDR